MKVDSCEAGFSPNSVLIFIYTDYEQRDPAIILNQVCASLLFETKYWIDIIDFRTYD